MRSLFVAVFAFGVIAAACTTAPQTPTVAATATATATASAIASTSTSTSMSASPDPSAAWAKDFPKAWTDPRVVRALAADCDFVPKQPPIEQGALDYGTPADVFACKLGYSQSCVVDPCLAYSMECEPGCESRCSDCGSTCSASCKTCKASCTDDACRAACASSCAECKQTCTRTMDRCVSGECSKERLACTKRLTGIWKSSGCAAKCAQFSRCMDPCTGAKNYGDCSSACEAKISPGYAPCVEKCVAGPASTRKTCTAKCLETAPCSSMICMMGASGEH